MINVLYIDLRPGQTWNSKVMDQKEVTHSDGSYEKKSRRRAWLKKWDKVKIPWYTQRLMHRKRVTCELHDSYFRLMTIKHAIPKIELAIELLYNSVMTGSQLVWKPDELEIRCGRENQHPEKLGSRAPGWANLENEKDTMLMAIRVGVNMLQYCSVSISLSHENLTIKWGVYFSKRLCCSSSLRLLLCRYDSICICICIMCLYS